ncbi:MAG: DNA mismatch repair protein MutL, partial [Bacteroidaceae bacterium]|nr:DNA mismatch repair protein MutL [Bacteroidaceae bacterium]
RISGYVGKPESSKKKGAHQYFFVNGRYMRHPYFHSAVMKAYENMIPAGEHVSYFLYFSVEPSAVDVNVHPTKTEIKFDNEQPIWQVLSAAVKETIGRFCNVPMIDFDVEGRPDIPVMGADATVPRQPKLSVSTYNPFKESGVRSSSVPNGWDSLYDESRLPDVESMESAKMSDETLMLSPFEQEMIGNKLEAIPEERVLQGSIWNDVIVEHGASSLIVDASVPKFQYKGRYIILPCSEGVMVVNQHRAHVRVLFDHNMQCINTGNRPSQKELFPNVIQFDKEDALTVEDMMDDICSLGFELSNLGGGAYSINGIPSGIEGVDIDSLLHDMVVAARENTNNIKKDAQEAMALTMAENAAIVYGQVLTIAEMEHLLQNLFATKTPARTPDGKLIYTIWDDKSLNDAF